MGHPPIEYATSAQHPGLTGWRSLSDRTGLPLDRIAELGLRGELRCLFDGNVLRSKEEIRSLDRGGRLRPTECRNGHLALVEILGKRWPAEPQTPAQLIAELQRRRGEWWNE